MTAPSLNLVPLNRSLDQELGALVRGVSFECLVCGEFVLHRAGTISCPECQAEFRKSGETRLQLTLQAG